MKSLQGCSKEIPVQMCIDFGGGDAFVAEHFLDGAKVGTALNEMGGKGMP